MTTCPHGHPLKSSCVPCLTARAATAETALAASRAEVAVRDTQLANMKELARLVVESREALTDERDAARAEVERLRAALEDVVAALECRPYGFGEFDFSDVLKEARAALASKPAPGAGVAPAIVLTAEQAEKLVAMIDDPSPPNETLRKLMANDPSAPRPHHPLCGCGCHHAPPPVQPVPTAGKSPCANCKSASGRTRSFCINEHGPFCSRCIDEWSCPVCYAAVLE